MSENQKQTRREFIKIFSLGGTGLFLAAYVPISKYKAGVEPKIFLPSVFIKIDLNGLVTIIIPRSEMGQGVFTSLPMLIAEELEVDLKMIKVEQAYGDKKFGDQNTGGSTSIRYKYEPLRLAGATARKMLISVAASKWKAKPAICRSEKGFIINKLNGKKISYGDLVEDASKLAIPENVKLKDPKDFKIIGKRIHRIDTPAKVYGETAFGIDYKIPEMYYATIVHCPAFGGKIIDYDASKTKTLKGIKEIIAISDGIAVIAESTWLAFKSKQLVKINWALGENINLSSENIHKLMVDKLNEPGEVITRIGSPVSKRESDKEIESIYEVPYLAHATLEPMNCLANYKNGKVEIWAPTQNPQGAQMEVAKALGLKEENVTVYVTFIGGGFGRRGDSDFAVEAAEISKRIGKPVKLIWSRDEDMKHDFYRPASIHKLKGIINNKGNLISLKHQIITSSIEEQKSKIKLEPSRYDFKGCALEKEYQIPYMELTGSIVTLPIPLGYWRAVYRSQNPFALESFIDEIAFTLKKDPFEFRRDMLVENSRLRNVLEIVAEKSDWYKKPRKNYGRGIACITAYDSYYANVAEVMVDQNNKIKIEKFICAVDCGLVINPDTIEAQIQSSIAFALSAALKESITIKNGRVVESNFDNFPILFYEEMPKVEVHIVKNALPVGGIGELGIGACAPALCNAIYDLTGKRIRKLPVNIFA